MAIHRIIYLSDPRLRKKCDFVDKFDDELSTLVDDMFETMHDAKGVGLAANQIGICRQIAVIDTSEDYNQPLVLINPELLASHGQEKMQEGCLSVPGHYDKALRATQVKMRAQDRTGKSYELEAEGLLAQAIQHEIDHLNGKLYIDYLSSFKRRRIEKKFEKHAKQNF